MLGLIFSIVMLCLSMSDKLNENMKIACLIAAAVFYLGWTVTIIGTNIKDAVREHDNNLRSLMERRRYDQD